MGRGPQELVGPFWEKGAGGRRVACGRSSRQRGVERGRECRGEVVGLSEDGVDGEVRGPGVGRVPGRQEERMIRHPRSELGRFVAHRGDTTNLVRQHDIQMFRT